MRVLVLATLVILLAGCLGTPLPAGTKAPAASKIVERLLTPADARASEVSIAANPRDPSNLVAAANSGGGFGVYWTLDGGLTWKSQQYAASRIAPVGGQGQFVSLSDPAVAFAPDGTAYLAGLAIIPTSSVWIAKSTDGGATWGNAKLVHQSDLAASFNDKEWLGISKRGTLIVAWQKEFAMDQMRTAEGAINGAADLDVGDIVVSRSTDGGNTWTLVPVKISRGMHNNGTQIQFTADDRGHILWVNYEANTLDYVSSDDDGATWSAPVAAAHIHWRGPLPRYSNMHTLPGFAASPTGKTLAAVWHDARNGDTDIYAATSADEGKTWNEPVRVNDDPIGNGVFQLYPWVTVDDHGRVIATFYDSRVDPAKPRFVYSMAAADGPGQAFGPTMQVSSVPFTVFSPAPGGAANESHDLGHYTGVTVNSLGIFPAWADGRGAGSQIYSARVALDAPSVNRPGSP